MKLHGKDTTTSGKKCFDDDEDDYGDDDDWCYGGSGCHDDYYADFAIHAFRSRGGGGGGSRASQQNPGKHKNKGKRKNSRSHNVYSSKHVRARESLMAGRLAKGRPKHERGLRTYLS